MPSLHDNEKSDNGRDRTQSWVPEEFTSVPLSSLRIQKKTVDQTLEPMTLKNIGWSDELTGLMKSDTHDSAPTGNNSENKSVATWQMPEISQFIVRNGTCSNSFKQPGMNAALDNAAKVKVDAEIKASQIIDKAQKDAKEIIDAGLLEVEHLRRQGYNEGVEASRKEAMAILQMAQNVLEEANRWQQQTMAESEPAIIEMIKSISQDLFGEGYVLNVQEIEGVITRAISQASRLGDLRVYMNPEDAIQLISLWQESEIVLNGQKIALVSSQNIQRGGCFIDGQYGNVDSRVPQQLAQIHKSLDGTLADRKIEQE